LEKKFSVISNIERFHSSRWSNGAHSTAGLLSDYSSSSSSIGKPIYAYELKFSDPFDGDRAVLSFDKLLSA
jgi:hypothetical protein